MFIINLNTVWEQRKLTDEVELFKGLTYSPSDVSNSGCLVLRSSNVKNGEIISADNVYVNYSAVNTSNVNKGDIIIVVRNGSRDLIGKHALIKNEMPKTVIGAFMTGFHTKNSEYINSLLDSNKFKKEVNKNLGATINQITNGMFNSMEFLFPNSQEQYEIGSIFHDIDNLITLHQRKYEKLKIVKQSLLEKMFPKNGEDIPAIRFKGFTDSWEQRKFEELFSERRQKTIIENEDTLLSCAIEGIYLNSELFSHFRGSSNKGYIKVKKNDLILSAQNLHLGNANINLKFKHGIISPAYKVYDLLKCDPNFIQAWVKKDETKKFFLKATTEGASGCRKNVEWKTLYNQTLAVTMETEQKLIGKYFQQLNNLITLHQRKLEKLQKIKKSLLEKMFV